MSDPCVICTRQLVWSLAMLTSLRQQSFLMKIKYPKIYEMRQLFVSCFEYMMSIISYRIICEQWVEEFWNKILTLSPLQTAFKFDPKQCIEESIVVISYRIPWEQWEIEYWKTRRQCFFVVQNRTTWLKFQRKS